MELHEIEITALSSAGWGQGETATGASVEVIGALPGDQVSVLLGHRRRSGYRARPEQWLRLAPGREEPRCVHFGECGGCRWQAMGYPAQLAEKERRVASLFAHHTCSVRPILPSPSVWRYRNKMEFTFSSDRAGRRFLGLCMAAGRGRVVSLSECHLAPEWMTDAMERTRQWWEESGLAAYHPPSDSGDLLTLTCREGRRTGDRVAILTVSRELPSFPELPGISLVVRLRRAAKGVPTYYEERVVSGSGLIEERLDRLTFSVSPSAFFQPNTEAAERLYREVVALGEVGPEMTVYDLYCGTGTLALFLAQMAGRVVGVELVEEAILDARRNAERNGITNAEFHVGDVGALLKELPPPDLAVVDPPRAGLGKEVVDQLVAHRPEKIIYVSCNPKSQVVDIDHLVEEGYRLAALQPLDQFPHTLHVENIALLVSSHEVCLPDKARGG